MSIQPLGNNPLPTSPSNTSSRSVDDANAPQAGGSPKAAAGAPAGGQQVSPANPKDAVREATQKANLAVEGLRSDLKFTVDSDTGTNVVKVIDTKTKEVIRQIPAQEMLEIAKRLDELRGILIKARA